MSSVVRVPLERLPAWTGGNPVIRAESSPVPGSEALAVRDGDAWAAAFARPTHTHGTTLMLHGGDGSGRLVPPAVVDLLEDLVSSPPFAGWLGHLRTKGVDGVTLPRAASGLGGLLQHPRGLWEWMSTTTAPPGRPGPGVVELVERHRQEVQCLLDEHNPGTDGQPFVRPGQRWIGVRDDEGGLLAVGCCEPERSGAPVLSGITVLPSARGRGLGREVTAELTRGAVTAHGWCTLGMYSVNDTARRLYHSLGYETGAVWSSGGLG